MHYTMSKKETNHDVDAALLLVSLIDRYEF